MLMRNVITASKYANCVDFTGCNNIIPIFHTRKHKKSTTNGNIEEASASNNDSSDIFSMCEHLNITRNMGQDGDGHAHFDQIWRPNITINYMGVDQNIKF
jgi:hypothetical protein